MGKYLNNLYALTIVEVLVAIILTAIVMIHGTIFFIATWRLNTESKEYNMILNDVVANLENYISKPYNKNAVATSDYLIKTGDRKLRNNDNYVVTYTLTKDSTFYDDYGFFYITSSAEWKCGSGDYMSNTVINIKTACTNNANWPKA